MKSARFNKVDITMERGNGYGQYYYVAENYKGKKVKVHTTNSEAWDWIDDDSNKGKTFRSEKKCLFSN